ncbi:MAG: Lamin Tail Domain, partial [Pseudomonadota bacterium]
DGGWVLYPRDQVDTSGFVGWTGGVEALAAGDLVLSEVFSSSSSSACGTDGSYLEVANVSGRDVDLDGLLVYDLGADRPLFQVRATTPVASGDRAVFVSGGDINCLGLVSDAATTWAYPGTFLGLYNRRSLFDLLFPGVAVPGVGAASELKDAYLAANSNDVAAAWCSATAPFVGSDLGTPGGPASCGAP